MFIYYTEQGSIFYSIWRFEISIQIHF